MSDGSIDNEKLKHRIALFDNFIHFELGEILLTEIKKLIKDVHIEAYGEGFNAGHAKGKKEGFEEGYDKANAEWEKPEKVNFT